MIQSLLKVYSKSTILEIKMKLYKLMQKLHSMQQIIIKDRNESDNIYSGFLSEASGSWIFQDMKVINIWAKGPYLVIEVER